MVNQLITSVTVFLQDNIFKIIVIVSITAIFYFIFYLSTYSLKKLKIEVFPSYPFGLFFPEGGVWSIGYFLLIILLLGLLTYFGFKGGLFLGPA